jgi:hypothetical protein
MVRSLIYCPACNQLIPNYQGYELTRDKNLPGVEWSGADLAAAKEFLRTHLGHRLEELLVEEDSWVSQLPSHEPLRVSYCFAGNAGKRVLVQRTKSALNLPASYEIVPGVLEISNVSVKIQEDDLRRQIEAETGFSPLLKERMEKFIQVFRDEITRIPPDQIGEETGEIYPGEETALAHAGLKPSRWKRILSRCRLYFDKDEMKSLGRFIEENNNPPDVLSVQIERRISIIPFAGEGSGGRAQEREETAEDLKTPAIAIFKKRA